MGSNDDWQSFLKQEGAVLVDGEVLDFGSSAVERRRTQDSDIISDLSHLSLIRAKGEDAASFLQGQLSNDIHQVTESRGQLSAYSSPQGRMFAIFRVFFHDGAYFLQLPRPLAQSTIKRLRMFILRAKVALEIADSEWVRIGVSGPSIEAMLADIGVALPGAVDGCESRGDSISLRLPGPWPRFEMIGRVDAMKELWSRIRPHVTATGKAAWSWLDIAAGIPAVMPETVEEFVPQMANLDLLGGINFKKGCYPGQEIVARMHYLGRLKQRMIRASVDAATLPLPGTAVYAPDFPGQSAGTVVDAQPGAESGFDLLVIVQLSSLKNGEFHLAVPDGPCLRLAKMPYSLDAAADPANA